MSMTLTELEKLEALHAAATPGEWTGDRHDGTVKYRLHSENCECDREESWNCPHLVLSVDHKNGTSGFLGAHSTENEKLVPALHNAFPAMAKALREAWKERENYRNDAIKVEANEAKATDALHVAHALLSYLVEELAVVEISSQKLLVALSSHRLVRLREQARTHLLATMNEGGD